VNRMYQIHWIQPKDWKVEKPKSKRATSYKVTLGYIVGTCDAEDDIPIIRYLRKSLIHDIMNTDNEYSLTSYYSIDRVTLFRTIRTFTNDPNTPEWLRNRAFRRKVMTFCVNEKLPRE
jgi:hypothetical protein